MNKELLKVMTTAALGSVIALAAGCVEDDVGSDELAIYAGDGDDDDGDGQQNCYVEWSTGGRAITESERNRISEFLDSGTICGEAKDGLRGVLGDMRMVSANCSWLGQASYNQSNGQIRLGDATLTNGRDATVKALVHEWGHKLTPSSISGEPAREAVANTYRDNCLNDRDWTMARQNPGGTGGGDGGGGDPPPPPPSGGGEDCYLTCVGYDWWIWSRCGSNNAGCCYEAGGYVAQECNPFPGGY